MYEMTPGRLAKELGVPKLDMWRAMQELRINAKRMDARLSDRQVGALRTYYSNKQRARVRRAGQAVIGFRPISVAPIPAAREFPRTCPCCDRRWVHREADNKTDTHAGPAISRRSFLTCSESFVVGRVLPPPNAHPETGAAAHPGLTVPLRYHPGMAMNLRLTDAESEALRKKAEQEGRSMQEVARAAIAQYVSERPQRLRAAIERVRAEDSELLERLSR